jgi:hypothetical protein
MQHVPALLKGFLRFCNYTNLDKFNLNIFRKFIWVKHFLISKRILENFRKGFLCIERFPPQHRLLCHQPWKIALLRVNYPFKQVILEIYKKSRILKLWKYPSDKTLPKNLKLKNSFLSKKFGNIPFSSMFFSLTF